MKKLENLFEAKTLNIQDETINYIDSAQLEKYLKVAAKFLSEDGVYVTQFLIDHNDTYMQDYGTKDNKNALENFYCNRTPKTDEEKQLYAAIGRLKKANRLLEIPVFQSQEQFDGIINNEISPDEILLDLETEKGKNEVAKKYAPLVAKICKQFLGKSNLSYDDLKLAAEEGLSYAMTRYGKNDKTHKDDEEFGKKIKAYTFGQFAAYYIRARILGDIQEVSRTVRIPNSAQKRERDERGANTKNNTISGDQKINTGSSKSEGNEKTVFDLTGGTDTATRDVDEKDIDRLWKEIYKILEGHFDDKIIDVFYSFMGLNGYKKMKNIELAKKYNVAASNITHYIKLVHNYIQNTPAVLNKFCEIRDLMAECRNEWERDEDDFEPKSIRVNENTTFDD